MFTDMEFDPADGLANKTSYPPTPASEDAARAQIQEPLNQVKAGLNGLMDELENSDVEVSGAASIGSEIISGVTGTTIREQVINLKAQIDNVSAGGLTDNIIENNHLSDDCVTGAEIADESIDNEHLAANAVLTEHITDGNVTQEKLGTIQEITLDTGDTLTYDTVNNKVKLNVSGCTAVELCPIVFGTSASAPEGTYPAGTMYVYYIA